MSYLSVIDRVRGDTEKKVMSLWVRYGKGQIDKARFVQLASAVIAQGSSLAAATADVAASLDISRAVGPIPPLGVLPVAYDADRFMQGLTTIIDGDGDIGMQLSRLSLNGPLDAAADAFSENVKNSPANGWVRQLDADPCQLCRWWWREGRVWPIDHPISRHKGCECTQRVVSVLKARKVSV